MDIAAVLRDHAARGQSGRLDVVTPRFSGQVWLHDGRVGTVSLSSTTPPLGMRLVSGGALSLNSLGTALATQKQNPQMRLGDVLVRMGLVTRQEVEAVAWEQMCDGIATLLNAGDANLTFTQVAAAACPPPGPTVDELLTAARDRVSRWQDIVREVGGSDTVPELGDSLLHTRDTTLRPEEWAILCRVDGRRTLDSIAHQAGFTTLEAAGILRGLLAAGLVSVPQTAITPPPPSAPAAEPVVPTSWGSVPDLLDDPSDLLRELSELGSADFGARRRTH